MAISKHSIDGKIKKKKKNGIYILLLLLCSFSFIVIFKTDIFTVKHVNIYGIKALSREEILQCSTIGFGNNIFREKLKDIESNLLQHPYIKNVKAKRNFPDTITIQILERTETAAIPFMGKYLIIDDQGIVLKTDSSSKNLKVVCGLKFRNFMEGKVLNIKDKIQFDRTINIIKEINKHQIPVTKVDVVDRDRIVIQFSDFLKAELGECEHLDYKFMLLKKILENLVQQDITRGVIDISHEGYPSYRPIE